MKVYTMHAYTDDENDPEWNQVPNPFFECVHLLGLYCPACKANWQFFAEADNIFVPEIPEPLQRILRDYETKGIRTYNQLMQTVEEIAREAEYLRQHGIEPNSPTLLPEDFAQLCAEVRRWLALPDDYPLRQRQAIFTDFVIQLVQFPPEWDFFGGGAFSSYYLSPVAAERLSRSGLTGFVLYPVEVYDHEWEFREYWYILRVHGRGGVPITQPEGYWYRCSRCGYWQLSKYQPYQFAIDPSQWDGSDFFHFVDYGQVVITERARAWLEQSGLRLWVEFEEPDWRWYLDAQAREVARAERRRMFGLTSETRD